MKEPFFRMQLPLPPTLNQYYRAKAVKGRVSVYKDDKGYKDDIGYVHDYVSEPTEKRLKISVVVHFATKARQDLDNRLKALQDALTGIVWVDDSQIDEIIIKRGEVKKGGMVELTVWEIDE